MQDKCNNIPPTTDIEYLDIKYLRNFENLKFHINVKPNTFKVDSFNNFCHWTV